MISALFSPFTYFIKDRSIETPQSPTYELVYQDTYARLVLLKNPLTRGSIAIEARDEKKLSEWDENQHKQTHNLLRKVIAVWKDKGIDDYLIYSKGSPLSSHRFEIVPYEKKGFSILQQFRVLWSVIFGGRLRTSSEQKNTLEYFQSSLVRLKEENILPEHRINHVASCNFCKQEVINRQCVYEGKKIRILYNYAPIVLGKDKLHFLMVPKEHREAFTDLTSEEYLETMALAKQLIDTFQKEGYHTAYTLNKTGKRAGQSVPHSHEHLIFTSSKTQEVFGKLMVLKNMLIGAWQLPKDELKVRVENLKKKLN